MASLHIINVSGNHHITGNSGCIAQAIDVILQAEIMVRVGLQRFLKAWICKTFRTALGVLYQNQFKRPEVFAIHHACHEQSQYDGLSSDWTDITYTDRRVRRTPGPDINRCKKEAICAIPGRASLQETKLKMNEPLLATHEKFTTD